MPGIQFGYCLPIFAAPGAGLFRTPAYSHLDPRATLALGTLADILGYDSLWVADHLMLGHDDAILEGWTTISALAGATRSAKLGMIHQANLLRNPAVAAKAAATLDQLSGGRLIHFPDFGNNRREHLAYGASWPDDTDARIAQFLEALDLTVALWTADAPLDHEGPHYRTVGAVCRPQPVQRPHPPIWLGEAHPTMLDATARLAQGWNTTPVSLADIGTRLDALRAACARNARPYDEIEKSLEIQILIAPDRDALRDRLRLIVALTPDTAPAPDLAAFISGNTDDLPRIIQETWLAGTPDDVAARIDAYVAAGISHFMLWFVDAPGDAGLRLFASEVMGRYR
jgi:alkanesulfonate monooxygenase SsuD/methylene tetrahydromethanopterin reductase-like flavin-dependent oxidoreductase (luciferase family)